MSSSDENQRNVIDEPIGKEEVLDLGESLHRVKNDPQKSLNLLRLLNRKAITAELL